jgi:hypothetical protein
VAAGVDTRLRWLPSERSPADAPSRRYFAPGVRGVWDTAKGGGQSGVVKGKAATAAIADRRWLSRWDSQPWTGLVHRLAAKSAYPPVDAVTEQEAPNRHQRRQAILEINAWLAAKGCRQLDPLNGVDNSLATWI